MTASSSMMNSYNVSNTATASGSMKASSVARRRLLDLHSALRTPDGLHRLRSTAAPPGGRELHPPRLPRLLPHRALVGQVRGTRRTAHPHGLRAPQGVGLRRLRHHARLRPDRPPRRRRSSRSVDLVSWDWSALGVFVLLLAAIAGYANVRLTAHSWPFAILRPL